MQGINYKQNLFVKSQFRRLCYSIQTKQKLHQTKLYNICRVQILTVYFSLLIHCVAPICLLT